MRGSVLAPLSDIAQATDRITTGDIRSQVPHLARYDEIGRLARAVQNFRDAVAQIFELDERQLPQDLQSPRHDSGRIDAGGNPPAPGQERLVRW
ncbi:HAMP domain-containing protein [Bradyrhizobium guangdongense]|uniref:HAMP domain-containing protein n=1 Tax=Bradyrhizobium guangdongense TaxID=1325090 RepID=A0ABX6UQZ8_9BRAD|nr:HAMP domain-containing protein [Bradyrhizobium guangdongense]QAU42725.1 hypothetical protein X265_15765 [Bradyrhizobium guangdongense]QOZ63780.1 hypothetical protein XH86_15770 [Bradyrhizobium guangdongense]